MLEHFSSTSQQIQNEATLYILSVIPNLSTSNEYKFCGCDIIEGEKVEFYFFL